MSAGDLEALLRSLKGGKRVGRDLYFHIGNPEAERFISTIARLAASLAPDPEANVIKIRQDPSGLAVSGLFYNAFFTEPFPTLKWSQKRTMALPLGARRREFANPPILHRKELLLGRDHPKWEAYAALTKSLIMAELLPASAFIGRQRQWQQYLAERGFRVVGHTLERIRDSDG